MRKNEDGARVPGVGGLQTELKSIKSRAGPCLATTNYYHPNNSDMITNSPTVASYVSGGSRTPTPTALPPLLVLTSSEDSPGLSATVVTDAAAVFHMEDGEPGIPPLPPN